MNAVPWEYIPLLGCIASYVNMTTKLYILRKYTRLENHPNFKHLIQIKKNKREEKKKRSIYVKASSFTNLSHKADRKSSSQCVHAILREYWICCKRQKCIVWVYAACVLLCEQRLVISLKHL